MSGYEEITDHIHVWVEKEYTGGKREVCSICNQLKSARVQTQAPAIPIFVPMMAERDFWIAVRAAILAVVAAIEKRWGIEPKR